MNRQQLIERLSEHLRIAPASVEKIISSAHRRYKHYTLPKRTGGERHIFHPTPELKAIQRWLISNVFSQLPVHGAAYAYEKGCSIQRHATEHRRSNYFLRMDFSDFFPSINEVWIRSFLRQSIENQVLELNADAIDSVCRLTCRRSRLETVSALSIGAPSSPSVSNRILFSLDHELSRISEAHDVIYTRYADDLYFSTRQPNVLSEIEGIVRESVAIIAPRLSINRNKTQRSSRKRKITITGMVITSDRKISLGRELKRSIKTQIHLWKSGNLAADSVPTLRGLISYAAGAESSFYQTLQRKYGETAIERLLNPGSE